MRRFKTSILTLASKRGRCFVAFGKNAASINKAKTSRATCSIVAQIPNRSRLGSWSESW